MDTASSFLPEGSWRTLLFAAVLGGMILWECLAPRRRLAQRRITRWSAHLALAAINAVVVRLAFPAACVGVALFAEQQELGLLRHTALPYAATVVLAFVLLDLAMYFQHLLFHAVPLLWRLHLVHHADPEFDVTTGIRFHPLEMLVSACIKALAIVSIGAPVLAVVWFEIVLTLMSLFTHANIRLPERLDRALRWLVVTPDMHRIHHSISAAESNSNFGFNLAWWDRLLGTYCRAARSPQSEMVFGVAQFRESRLNTPLSGLLRLPFVDGAPQRQETASRV